MARKFLLGFVATFILSGVALLMFNRPDITQLPDSVIIKNISPVGGVCLVGEVECGPNQTSDVAAVEVEQQAPGKAKFSTCGSCHGVDGSGGFGPALKGRDVDYIVGKLRAYRAKEQLGANSSVMWGQASALSDSDIGELADYIATL